jgi:hypothetical protein
MSEYNNTLLSQLEKALLNHDWLYFTSDSNKLYQEGKASQSKINSLMATARSKNLTEQAEALYIKYYKLNQQQR